MYVVTIMLLWGTGLQWLAIVVAVLYLSLVVYSWTVAPLARWWMHRKLR